MARSKQDVLVAASRLETRQAYLFTKRLFDIGFSASVIVLFWWVYALVAIAIKLDTPGPALFFQERVGKSGKVFRMAKFRSMCKDAERQLASLQELNERDGPAFKIKDDPRITRVGKFIRRTNLDELPQFANVLLGQMSVVGPRPALPQEVEQYDDLQRMRLLITPGITCFWQVDPRRDEMSFDEWIDHDLEYIERCGIGTDLMLILRTVESVIRAQGS